MQGLHGIVKPKAGLNAENGFRRACAELFVAHRTAIKGNGYLDISHKIGRNIGNKKMAV